jgi:DNA polymerase delta subunit 1
MKMPPLRILSFDIECAAEHGFPDPEKHQIIQIACVCKTSNQIEEDYRVVFALHGADKISGVHVKSSDDEEDLLLNFEKLMITYDPDFITGYNMVNFDLNYILERAKHLEMSNYGMFGRSKGILSKIKNSTFQSKIMGNRDTK